MNPYLILVNKAYPVPKDYLSHVELISAFDIHEQQLFLEQCTFRAFEALAAYLKETEHITVGIGNGYRSLETQQQIYSNFCRKYGKEYADAIVAPVGNSEHHMGICIDLSLYFEGEGFLSNNDHFDRICPVFEKHVHPHLSRFGFLLRYPRGKEGVTGYPYEPWHIRYVGPDAAQEIAQKGLTLEEWYSCLEQ